METKKRQVLQRCTVELVRDMDPDAMKGALFARQMLTPDEVERLSLPVMTRRDKNLFILQKMPSKGTKAFDYFIDCLQETSEDNPVHMELIEQLMKELNNPTDT